MIAQMADSLATIRRLRAWTQRELATRAGVGVTTIRDLERGAGPTPSLPTVRKLCDALGIEPRDCTDFHRSIGLVKDE
jgi:transcriptional regulator with XRE-family HTH domain